MTIATINKKIAHRGIELVKGRGYFYFAILDGFPDDTELPSSIFVPHFNQMTIGQWMDAAK